MLQSISLVSRDSKNKYIWSGTNKMIDSINELKIESLKLPTSYQLQSIVSDNNNNNNNSDSRKSLTCLSKEFIMMFLKGEREIFFDNIAKALIGDVNNAVIKSI